MLTKIFISSFIALLANSYEYKKDEYFNYDQMTEFLRNLASENPNTTRLYSIGHTELGRELWVLEVTSGVNDPSSAKPNVKLVGNVHGNDPVTRQLLLAFAKWLLDEHRQSDATSASSSSLLGAVRLHLLPCLDADGAALNAAAETPGTASGCGTDAAGWKNSNDVDLDNNFPDAWGRTEGRLQKETLAVMGWMDDVTFSLSASLKAGALLAVYPYHARPDLGSDESVHLTVTADYDVFAVVASSYARAHPSMHLGRSCPGDAYKFPGGLVNGAIISPRAGSMMDYNYRQGCLEITIAVSCCRYPLASELPSIWADNKEGLVSFAWQAARGVRGSVVNEGGAPVAGAVLHVAGRNATFHSSRTGHFWRILPPGVYFLQIYADGFESQEEVPVTVGEDGRSAPLKLMMAASGRGRNTRTSQEPRWSPKRAPTTTNTEEATVGPNRLDNKSCRPACLNSNLYVFVFVMVFTVATLASLAARIRSIRSQVESVSK